MNKNTLHLPLCISRLMLVCCILTMLLQGSFAELAVHAAAGNTDTFKVGFFAFSGYHEIDEDGTRTGYGYEFFQKISILDDWTFEYVGYDRSYADSLEMLQNGELDVVTSVSKSPEREKIFLFSEEPIGTNSTIFTVKEGNTHVIAGDYTTYDGLKIGMLTGNSKNNDFENFSKEHGFAYTPAYYTTESELTQALQTGAVDGIVSGSLRRLNDEWLIESMNEANFYVAVNKDAPELMDRINAAIHELDLNESDWRSVLHQKYYATDSGGTIMLDADERAYLEELLASGRTLHVLMNPAVTLTRASAVMRRPQTMI